MSRCARRTRVTTTSSSMTGRPMSAAEREAEQRWPSVTVEEISYPRSAVRAYMRGAFVAGAEWQAEQDAQAQHAYTVRHLHDSHWRCACGHPLVDVSDKAGPASKDVLVAVLAEHEAHKRESRAGDQ